ncbi:MAG TPA: hypothetical protein VMU59_08720 [Caulobacteraceae bacterium]|nr:hypothetical protein [Caulobacteraceae bacterium]
MPISMLIRQIHTWLAVFIAPSVLFFAITGGLQLYHLHENHGDYQAPALLQELASVHKDQIVQTDNRRHGPPPADAGKDHGPSADADQDHGQPAADAGKDHGPSADADKDHGDARGPGAPDAGPPGGPPPGKHGEARSAMALKFVFLIVSACLVVTTLLGLWMTLKYSRNKVLCAVLFGLGILLPLSTFLL